MTLANLIDLDIVIPKKWPNIGIYKIGLHMMQALFSFLGFCVLTTVISAEKNYLVSEKYIIFIISFLNPISRVQAKQLPTMI